MASTSSSRYAKHRRIGEDEESEEDEEEEAEEEVLVLLLPSRSRPCSQFGLDILDQPRLVWYWLCVMGIDIGVLPAVARFIVSTFNC